MLALPPRIEIPFDEEQKYWSEILDMCHAPTKSKGLTVRIKQPILRGGNIKPGKKGVVRPFNPVDYKNLYKEYCRALHWGSKHYPLPDMTCVYDFFMDSEKGGLTYIHIHIAKSEFEFMNNQLSLFEQAV